MTILTAAIYIQFDTRNPEGERMLEFGDSLGMAVC